jgi:hypothetical protein
VDSVSQIELRLRDSDWERFWCAKPRRSAQIYVTRSSETIWLESTLVVRR